MDIIIIFIIFGIGIAFYLIMQNRSSPKKDTSINTTKTGIGIEIKIPDDVVKILAKIQQEIEKYKKNNLADKVLEKHNISIPHYNLPDVYLRSKLDEVEYEDVLKKRKLDQEEKNKVLAHWKESILMHKARLAYYLENKNIKGIVYCATLDYNTCDHCRNCHDLKFKLGSSLFMKFLKYMPPIHFGCRCTILDSEEIEERNFELTKPDITTFNVSNASIKSERGRVFRECKLEEGTLGEVMGSINEIQNNGIQLEKDEKLILFDKLYTILNKRVEQEIVGKNISNAEKEFSEFIQEYKKIEELPYKYFSKMRAFAGKCLKHGYNDMAYRYYNKIIIDPESDNRERLITHKKIARMMIKEKHYEQALLQYKMVIDVIEHTDAMSGMKEIMEKERPHAEKEIEKCLKEIGIESHKEEIINMPTKNLALNVVEIIEKFKK